MAQIPYYRVPLEFDQARPYNDYLFKVILLKSCMGKAFTVISPIAR